MQNAKDTFYLTLQQRLAALNPQRILVVREQRRSGTLVVENEAPTAQVPLDCFRLQWTSLSLDRTSAMPLVALTCEISYATDGTRPMAGMDRGRLLSAMDSELASALSQPPLSTPKLDCTASDSGTAPVPLATNVFWSEPAFAAITATGERLSRTASVQVFAFQEAGEA